jgi:putative flippase GtrA
MAFPEAGLYARVRLLLPELLKFGVVGGLGSVIDLGGAAVLHGKYHVGPLESKAISTALATVFTYLGSRFWTFKDRENQSLRREAVLFVLLNVAGLLIAMAVIALVTYVLGLRGQLEYNAASVLGTGLATIFRYFAYRQWVFTAPADAPLAAAAAAAAEMVPFPDYAPWEIDPGYLQDAPHRATAPVEYAAAPVGYSAPRRPAAPVEHSAPVEYAGRANTGGWAQAPRTAYSGPWEPAAGQDHREPTAPHRPPWTDKQVTFPGEEPAEPFLAQSFNGQDGTTADPLGGQPFQGRHRRS